MNYGRDKKIGGRYIQPPICANNMTDNHVVQRYDFIPIDYVCCEVIGIDKECLLENRNLTFTPILKNGDLLHSYYHMDRNLKIKIYESGRITLEGSLHKYANSGLHNYNDFTFDELDRVLNEINTRFGITPENMRITCMEYGFNVQPPIDPDLIIDHLLKHKDANVEIQLSSDRAKYRQFRHCDYIIKVYNKGKQYQCKNQILRIEIKQTRWDKNRKKGIVTMKDFIQSDKSQFIEDLIQKWEEILFYDPTMSENKKFICYRDIIFWNELRNNVSRKTYCKHVNRLKELNRTQGNNIQKNITDILRKKAHQLNRVTNNTFHGIKVCKVTGIEIKNQRENSFLLSHGGLKYLINEDPEQYTKVEQRYLSRKWINEDIQTKIKEIAHNIRSHYTRKMKQYNVNQLTIFTNTNHVIG